MPPRLRLLAGSLLFALVVLGAYAGVRTKRSELVDFAVPRTAAARFLAHEPLYRPDDGHYQYKYLPVFALAIAPFTWVPKEAGELLWFTLIVAMTWGLLRLSLSALPDRRLPWNVLWWVTLLLTGKFVVKELAFGQFNLPVALLLLGAIVAAQRGKVLAAGAFVALGVFVKPYALVLVPWLVWTLGWRPFVSFGPVLAAGLVLPAAFYGWNGNLTLLHDWYRTVTETSGPNLLTPENISFASMWAKWIEPGPAAAALAVASVIAAVVAGCAVMWQRWRVAEPNYLEGSYFFVLVPLVSPQGWDYVLLIALPAYVCLADRWRELSPAWRAIALTGFVLTSFTIFDLLRRDLYTHLMHLGAVSVGAILIAACLIHMRSRAMA